MQISQALATAFAIVAMGTVAYGQSAMPACMSACLANMTATQPCNSQNVLFLTSCVLTNCKTTSSGLHQASQMTMTFTPKLLYSCQQSLVPGSNMPSASFSLSGAGECASSPYNFRSFVTGGDTQSLSAIEQPTSECSLSLYVGTECQGGVTTLDMNTMPREDCHFRGGRSAKLLCGGRNEQQIAISHINAMCAPPSAPAKNSTTTSSLTTSVNSTTSQTLVPATPQPFEGSAAGRRVATGVTVAGFVALYFALRITTQY